MSEVYDRYVDTAGNYHYTDVETGHHVIPCGYCHEDRDGFIAPLDRNAHAYILFPNRLRLKFGNEKLECEIKYCPMCGRNLKDGKT